MDTAKMNNAEIVNLLYDCKIAKCLPEIEGVNIELDKHDTATHCHIYLLADGEDPLLIFYKTNWISDQYEFNERGKVIGIQKGCGWAEPIILNLLAEAQSRMSAIKRKQAEAEKKLADASKSRYQAKVDTYKKLFSGRF